METLFIGKSLIFLPETDSTNSYAISLLKNVNPPEGTVVYTDHQYAGRGQRGSSWDSEALSNITASVILRPVFLDLSRQLFLYQITALACFDTLAHFLDPGQFDIKIKWPNDILVNGKKISGILIENSLSNDRIRYSVIGIGINLNQTESSAPNFTSYKRLTGSDISRKVVLAEFCVNLEKHYLALKQNRFEALKELYVQRMYGLSDRLPFEIGDSIRHMTVKGVMENGLLQLQTDQGEVLEADVREVKWLFRS